MRKNIFPNNFNAASLLVSEDCNLACKYCFEEPRQFRQQMPWEVAKRSIDILSRKDNYHLMLFGGEPFLNFKLLKEIIDYGYSLKVPFSANIITNGTIMNNGIKEWLKEAKTKCHFSVQVSVDGPKDIHDEYRVDKKGRGSFDRIEKNIPDFKEALLNEKDQDLNVHGCLNKNTIGRLYETYKFFKDEWGIPWIWMMPIHGETWENSDVGIYHEQLKKIKDDIVEDVKRTKDIKQIKYFSPLDKVLNYQRGHSKPCGAGTSFLTITANGDIWPCHEFYYNDPDKLMRVGNIFDGVDPNKLRVFNEYEHSDLGCPTSCDIYGCYRCIADNYRMNGSMFAQIRGPRCMMSKVENQVMMELNKEMEELGFFDKGGK